jgi:4-hydroxy-2-oxoheptanedioate aldolase
MPAHNPFKAALAANQPQVGLWLSMADPYMAEVSATAGFDWLLVDGEHAPNDLRSTLAALQAVAPHRAQPVVRAVQGDTALIKQLLDIGAKNLLVPMVDTAGQARALVSATRYPPRGIRGVGSAVGRASQWSARTDYLDAADDEVCLLVQAETVQALDNLASICEVDGVHGVFIGPADLAAWSPRGAGGHRRCDADYRGLRQSRRHADLRSEAGAPLPRTRLHLRRRRRRRAAVRGRRAQVGGRLPRCAGCHPRAA